MWKLTAILVLTTSSIWICKSSISISMPFRAFTAAAQVNSDSSSCEAQWETWRKQRTNVSGPRSRIPAGYNEGFLHCCNFYNLKSLFVQLFLSLIKGYSTDIFWIRSKIIPRRTYLIFELDNLPFAGGIALQVVQHDLCISQKDFCSLQVFL